MLSRLSVRGKFLAALGVPIVVLFLAASFITWQSVSSWRAADQTNSLLGALTAQDAVGHDLAAERSSSLQYLVAGSPAAQQQLAEARKQTDADVATLRNEYDGLNLSALDSKVSSQVSATVKTRGSIAALRAKVDDRSISEPDMITGYGSIIDQGLRVPTAVAQTTDDRKLGQYLDAYVSLDSYMSQLTLSSSVDQMLLSSVADGGKADDGLRVQAAALATTTTAARAIAQDAVDALPGESNSLPVPDSTYAKIVTAIAGGQPQAVSSQASQWSTLWEDELASTTSVRDGVRSDTSNVASSSASSARNQALITAAVTLIVVALSILIAWVIARAVGGPLRRLTAAARNVRAQLPTLVEQVSMPGQRPTIDVAPISVESRDEVGQLASAFNDVNATTVMVAREQAALRGSIAEMFVNVARRDQVLLNRQLAFLDDLERTEEDPNELSNLFRLDHLATRMRRNSESLLILAGIDSGRRVRQPMPLSDVVRTAASEIELYDRIRLNLGVDPSMLGHNALNAAHLLAELLENATQYSEPHTPVEVTSDFDGHSVNVVIRDSGVGMSDQDRAVATQQANSFSSTEIIGAQRLGLHVVGRLANRLGAKVAFAPGPDGIGTTASVALPIELFVQDSSMPVTAPAAAQPTEQPQLGLPAGAPPVPADTPFAPVMGETSTTDTPFAPVMGETSTTDTPFAPVMGETSTTDTPFAPVMGETSTLPVEEPPAALPVDLDALTDGTTSTGMPKRKTSRSDAGVAAPSSLVGDQPITDGIVLPPLATPAFSFDTTSDEGWVPPEPVVGAASGSLPSRQRGKVPEEPAFPTLDGPPTLDVDARTGLFSSFRSMEELDTAVDGGAEHVTLDASAATGATDFSLPAETAGEEAATSGWMADLMGETPSSAASAGTFAMPQQEESYQPVYDPPADASLPLAERPTVEPDELTKLVGRRSQTEPDDSTQLLGGRKQAASDAESLPRFDDLISELPTDTRRGRSGRRAKEAPEASPDGWLEGQAQPETPADQEVPDADELSAPAPYVAQELDQPADYTGGFEASQPYYGESAALFEEVSPTRENPIGDLGRYSEHAEASVRSFGSTKGSDVPTERIEQVPDNDESAGYGDGYGDSSGYGETYADPLSVPFGSDITPVAPGEAPLGEWGAPSPLVRRHARGAYESEFGEDSVEAHSEWMASAVVFEEMSSLLRRGDSLGAHTAETGGAYEPERLESGQTGAGLTRRHRLAGTDANHDRFTARIERDPEQLRSKLSAFQSATARGRAVANEHQNRPDDVEHVTEPTSHTW